MRSSDLNPPRKPLAKPPGKPAGLRIVGGLHRGRRLIAPPGDIVRPTSDRAREALFNILSHGLGVHCPLEITYRAMPVGMVEFSMGWRVPRRYASVPKKCWDDKRRIALRASRPHDIQPPVKWR